MNVCVTFAVPSIGKSLTFSVYCKNGVICAVHFSVFLFQQIFTFAQAHFTNASAKNFFLFRLSKIFVAMIHIKCYFGNCIHIPI